MIGSTVGLTDICLFEVDLLSSRARWSLSPSIFCRSWNLLSVFCTSWRSSWKDSFGGRADDEEDALDHLAAYLFTLNEGGLGIMRLSVMVKALSFKLWWRSIAHDSLWAHYMHNKYNCGYFTNHIGISVYDSIILKWLMRVGSTSYGLWRGELYPFG